MRSRSSRYGQSFIRHKTKEREQIDRRIAEIKHALAQLGPLRPGSISRQYNICGTPGCRCKADPPEKHGPYHQLNYTWRARSRTEFVRDHDLAEVSAELDNYQQLRLLTEEWIDLGIVGFLQEVAAATIENETRERPTTGSRWKMVSDGAPICVLVGDSFEAPNDRTPGRTGQHSWTFRVERSGRATIELAVVRSWDAQAPAASVFRLTVTASD